MNVDVVNELKQWLIDHKIWFTMSEIHKDRLDLVKFEVSIKIKERC